MSIDARTTTLSNRQTFLRLVCQIYHPERHSAAPVESAVFPQRLLVSVNLLLQRHVLLLGLKLLLLSLDTRHLLAHGVLFGTHLLVELTTRRELFEVGKTEVASVEQHVVVKTAATYEIVIFSECVFVLSEVLKVEHILLILKALCLLLDVRHFAV